VENHIVLLGDSIFDNRAYTGEEPDVAHHLRTMLPPSWKVTLCALDGSTAADLKEQLKRVPSDASRLVVSIGGNDALMNINLLSQHVSTIAEALEQIGDRVARFEADYREAIESTLALGLPTTTCTVYNGNLESPDAPAARLALMTFNDVILRVAFEEGLNVIDLRLVCRVADDYAYQIEPSGSGGEKIAKAVASTIGATGATTDFSRVSIG
jgi:hypothetical protein